MKITIESTPQIVDAGGGVQCRVWHGTLPDGAPCQVLVRGIGVAGRDVAGNGFRELEEQDAPPHNIERAAVESLRDQVLQYWTLHQRACTTPGCCEKGDLLAFLAHSLGFTRQDVRNFESLLVRYDLECQGASGCLHPPAGSGPEV